MPDIERRVGDKVRVHFSDGSYCEGVVVRSFPEGGTVRVLFDKSTYGNATVCVEDTELLRRAVNYDPFTQVAVLMDRDDAQRFISFIRCVRAALVEGERR